MRTFFVILFLLLLAAVGVLWMADAISLEALLGEKRVKHGAQANKPPRSPGEASPQTHVTATGPLTGASGNVLIDPITITDCTTGAVVEGDIPSQVEGVLDDVYVDLGSRVVGPRWQRGEYVPGTLVAKVDDISAKYFESEAAMKANNDLPAKVANAKKGEMEARLADAEEALKKLPGTVANQEHRMFKFQRDAFDYEAQGHEKERQAFAEQWKRIQYQVELHKVRSAIPGEVVAVYKRKGESVKAQDPVCRVANFDRLRVEGLVDRRQAELLRPGMRALVSPQRPAGRIGELSGHTGPVTGLAITPDGRYLASSSLDRTVMLWDWHSNRGSLRVLDHNSEVLTVVADHHRRSAPYQFLTGCGNGRAYLWYVPVGRQENISKTELFDLAEGHFASVRCGAFHPNGNWVVTGGDDRRICLWNVADGKLLYRVESDSDGESVAHRGAVNALSFTPDGRLVSAGQDGTLRLWKVGETLAELVRQQDGRTGEVARVGVSRDGKRALFDHGEELRVLDLDNNLNTVGSIRNHGQEAFKNLAVFSTNGRLVLSSVPGRAQLWSVPATPEEAEFFRQGYEHGFYHHSMMALTELTARLAPSAKLLAPHAMINRNLEEAGGLSGLWRLGASELRHVETPTAAEISCAAFTPDDAYLFTGGDSLVRIWRVPSADEISEPLEATITFVSDEVIETGVKVRAELDNPRDLNRRLKSGTKVNLTLYPETATKPEGRVSRK